MLDLMVIWPRAYLGGGGRLNFYKLMHILMLLLEKNAAFEYTRPRNKYKYLYR